MRFGTLAQARATLQAAFSYPDFRPSQIPAVEAVLSGRDALLMLPTGGGKSLCYQVPALVREGLTVVVSPLISLMKDQVDALERRGVSATYLNSTVPSREIAERLSRARHGALKLLYLAPERLDHGGTLQQLQAIGVTLFAVDEAHCISEWGVAFRPSYRRLGAIREQLGNPQSIALTATATPTVRRDIMRQLRLANPTVVVAGFDRTNLTYHVLPTRSPAEKDQAAVRLLARTDAPAIVYTPTRNAVERVTAVLVRGGINAVAYHGGLEATRRQRAQESFMQSRARVIVATSAFGMGIDKPDVRLVMHHAMPNSLEAYYQEAGRAGRDGQASRCVLLHTAADRRTHEYFINTTHPHRATVERGWRALRARADTNGYVPWSADSLASPPPSVADPQMGAVLRVLLTAGACTLEPAVTADVWIRFIATAERVRRELIGPRRVERQLLRALWRMAGSALEEGVHVDLGTLAPVPHRWLALVPVLQRLEANQFVTWRPRARGLHLDLRVKDVAAIPVDWQLLARRRANEISRLDAMSEYARTRYCRRAYVLRYFGDTEVRSQCDGCDRCLGTTDVPPLGATNATMRTGSRPRSP